MDKKNTAGNTYWIWYPGDFELYHCMLQNFSRIERGKRWPAFWKSEGFRNRVAFRRTYELKEATTFTVYSKAMGFVDIEEAKYAFGEKIECQPGRHRISIHAARIDAVPSIYIEGEVIRSDTGWMVEDYDRGLKKVGYSSYFTRPDQDPAVWEFSEKEYQPIAVTEVKGGLLFEFETELTASLFVMAGNFEHPLPPSCEETKNSRQLLSLSGEQSKNLVIYPGESREEALDTKYCYYTVTPDPETHRCERVAVRFAFIPDCQMGDYQLTAIHQYIDIPVKVTFETEDPLLRRIWDVSEHTFRLCSGVFFIDGVKRDKWLWSGDAYQSILVNEYLFRDPEINRRTLRALGGNLPARTHINTILDYSLLWILGIWEHVRAYGDQDFLEEIYPLMVSYMEFFETQLDENGFLVGRPGDWIYIDWADMDKCGALCAEQMLYAKVLKVMEELGRRVYLQGEQGQTGADDFAGVVCEENLADEFNNGKYGRQYEALSQKIDQFFWDQEKMAYIDSFQSGKRNVTRHANIFAIVFDLVDEERKAILKEHVLDNESIPAITTPYFKLFEMDAYCRLGYIDEVLDKVKAYWGGMLEQGAVTFWEEYDPKQPKEVQYDMYGDRFGKSLCHAWAASPIYIFGKYLV